MKYLKRKKIKEDWEDSERNKKLDIDEDDMDDLELEALYYKMGD